MTPNELWDWMDENPEWLTSREIWVATTFNELTFHKLRRRIQSLKEKGRVMRRVKHESYKPGKASKYAWSYKGPVYEYRRVACVDM